MSLPVVAFAGVGLMGLPMCHRLLVAGYALKVWNRTPEKCLPLERLGALVVEEPGQLCLGADIVMLCLADAEAVREVVFGPLGIVQQARPGTLLVDFSSQEPHATLQMAMELERRTGMRWVDAPVSGGVRGAERGELVIMAGGLSEDVDSLRSLLCHLGQRITRMGGVGAGQVTKLCNQMIVACNALVVAEALALAENSGVDSREIAPALAGGFADSKPLQILAPQMADRNYFPIKWHVRTLLKDLDNVIKLSKISGAETPISNFSAKLMRAHADNGFMEADLATLIESYRRGV